MTPIQGRAYLYKNINPMNASSTALGAAFVALTLIMYTLVYKEIKSALARTNWDDARKQSVANRFLLVVVGWTALICGLSATGFFSDFSAFPPRIGIVLCIPLAAMLFLTYSKTVKELLPLIPARNIIRLQVFRVGVELLLWAAFVQNLIPVQMSFEGRNFDVVSGILAPVVAYFLVSSRTAIYIYNFIALGLLLNIVVIAVLSMPTPFRVFMNEPSNVLVSQFPFILLPGMLVPLAYGLAFLSLRQLGLLKQR